MVSAKFTPFSDKSCYAYETFVTFVHAGFDGTTRLSVHF